MKKNNLVLFNNKELTINNRDCALLPSKNPLKVNLYVLSDDKIEEGDWFIGDNISIRQCTLNNSGNINFKGGWYSGSSNCKKIIATTDLSLREHDDSVPYPKTKSSLPALPKEFIQEYINSYNSRPFKQDVISEVLVEYEYLAKPIGNLVTYDSMSNPVLKVNSSNEISITKVKDTYTREEVINLLKDFKKDLCNSISLDAGAFDKWINKNL